MVVDQPAADAEQARVAIDRHFDLPVLVALLRGGDEMLEPILDPLYRPLEEHRGEAGNHILRVKDQLGPEAAADIGRDHAHLVLVAPEHVAEQPLRRVRHLRRAPQRQPVFERVVRRHGAAALDRMAAAAVLPQRFAKDVRRFLERRVDVAVAHVELGEQVVRRLAMRFRRAGAKGGAAVGGRGQRLVVDVDERRRILGDISIVRHHDGERLPDMHRLVARERRAVEVLLVARARQPDHHVLGREMRQEVRADEDRMHAGQRSRGCFVDAPDRGMRMRAAHEGGVQHAGEPDIVDEAAFALQQWLVFEPGHRAADDPHARRRFAAASAASTMPW